jgi:hypothetical protein
MVAKIINLWMNGKWFHEICKETSLEMYQLLRFINNFSSFTIQKVITSIIRIASSIHSDKQAISSHIINWPSFIQYGINSQLQLDLFEMGLNDREAVLQLKTLLINETFTYESYSLLRDYLLTNHDITSKLAKNDCPTISLQNIERFLRRISNRKIL